MSYVGPYLSTANDSLNSIGWNVSEYTNGKHTSYTSGGNIYDVYTFDVAGNASITFTQFVNATMLIGGGGGGGGSVVGGGGGGGQVIEYASTLLAGTYSMYIGHGGSSGIYTGSYLGGFSGERTTIDGYNISGRFARGGGGGGGHNSSAYSGGWDMASYGLGGGVSTTGGGPGGGYGAGSGAPIASGTDTYFYSGGGNSNNQNYGSGGAGNTSAGVTGSSTAAGNGGNGYTSTISGASLSYGGGGGGGIRNGSTVVGNHASGGGGYGGYGSTIATTQGGDGTRSGGGGGGGWNDLAVYSQNGGRGGDGFVIISVLRSGTNSRSILFGIQGTASSSEVLDQYYKTYPGTYQIGTPQNPATNARQIRYEYGTSNGNYWYTINGKLLQLYTSFTNAPSGTGYILIAKGRESLDWWNVAGQNMNLLTSDNLSVNKVATLSNEMIMTLAGTSTWAGIRLVVNRFSGTNDSLYIEGMSNAAFSWQHFNASPSSIVTNVSHYNMNWITGNLYYSINTTTNWTDTLNLTGSANTEKRSFTASWSGHGAYQGWSAGYSITNGFQNTTEQHAIQLVNVYVQS